MTNVGDKRMGRQRERKASARKLAVLRQGRRGGLGSENKKRTHRLEGGRERGPVALYCGLSRFGNFPRAAVSRATTPRPAAASAEGAAR